MLTEQDARTKWCPFARVAAEYNTVDGSLVVVANRDGYGPGSHFHARCIASDCMAWEEIEAALHDVDTGKEKHPALGDCGLKRRQG